jgi:hypothetical protein
MSLQTILSRLRPSRSDLWLCFRAGLCQLGIYFLFSVNARALAQGRIGWTFFSDLVYAFVAYHLIRWVADNKNHWGQVGYVLGGAWGSVFAILLTKKLFGQ